MDQELKTKAARKLILEKSFQQFYAKGFKPSSINEIMKTTVLSKGAFYHDLKNKVELGVQIAKAEIQGRIYRTMIEPLYVKGQAKTIIENTFLNKF